VKNDGTSTEQLREKLTMTKAAENEGRYRLDRFGQWAGILNSQDRWGVVGVWVLKGNDRNCALREEEEKELFSLLSIQF